MNNIKRISCLILLIVFFSFCKKDNRILGSDNQPTEDALNSTFCDTSRINAHTLVYDSIASLNSNYKFLGSNQDPIFGRTDVGLYFNINMPTSNVNFGSTASLLYSEIILRVGFREDNSYDYLGEASSNLTYSVFAIDSTLIPSKGYYSNTKKLYNINELIAVFTGSYSTLGSEIVLRIPVNSDFAKAIFTNTVDLQSNDVFQKKHKGFYITSEGTNLNPISNQGIITKFDMDHDLSGFYLRYKIGSAADTNSFKFSFKGTEAVRFNTVKYQANQGASYLLTKQLEGDTSIGAENLFLKGLGATKIKVNIPFLKNYTDSFKVAVNRAEVVFNIDPTFITSSGKYNAPPRLALIPIDQSGIDTIPFDYQTAIDAGRYDGYYDKENSRYVFNIARHIQAIFNNKIKNNGFFLAVSNIDNSYSYYLNGVKHLMYRRDNYSERVVLAGVNKSSIKPKLNLSFIKYKKD